jgi:hypothetical protein
MNSSIALGVIPPMPGLEKEEPEFAQEDDIPRDDRPEAADELTRDERDGAGEQRE